jgi:hypothetical protein
MAALSHSEAARVLQPVEATLDTISQGVDEVVNGGGLCGPGAWE